MPAPYRHIIWDWNGTLLNDVDLCLEAINGILRARAMPVQTRHAYLNRFGFPVIRYYAELGFDFEKESFEDLSADFISRYHRGRDACPLHEHACRAVQTLHAAGVEQSILSAYREPDLVEVVGRFGLKAFFRALVGIQDYYAASKLEAGRRWLETSGWEPAATLLVGDTIHDFEVSLELGVDALLVPWGHQTRERLEKTRAPVLEPGTSLSEWLQSRCHPVGNPTS